MFILIESDKYKSDKKEIKNIKVAIASGFHLFPFRTEKLSLITPMVLRNSGRVGSCRFIKESCSLNNEWDSFFVVYASLYGSLDI